VLLECYPILKSQGELGVSTTYGFSQLTCTKLYPKYLGFRHQVFNEILKYNETGNPVFNFKAFSIDSLNSASESPLPNAEFDVEYDDYDTPKALHLAYVQKSLSRSSIRTRDSHEINPDDLNIMGCLRFLPTDGPYMIKDNIERGIWKNVELLVNSLPTQADVYEASRIAVTPRLDRRSPLRDLILDNLVYANVELGMRLGVKKMLGIMYDRVWNSVYMKRGVPISYISKPFYVDDGLPIIIGEIDTSEAVLAGLNQRYADQIANNLIKPPEIEPGTWLMHRYHVNKTLPLPTIGHVTPGIREPHRAYVQ
jgi:N-acyl-L-homoserine lactone synthetase